MKFAFFCVWLPAFLLWVVWLAAGIRRDRRALQDQRRRQHAHRLFYVQKFQAFPGDTGSASDKDKARPA